MIHMVFHELGPSPQGFGHPAGMGFPADRFRAILDRVRARRDVRISIDDGSISDLEIALPALVERGMTAQFFPCVGRLDRPGFLRHEDLKRFLGAGMSVGSHGMHHRSWLGMDEADLHEEIVEARERLEAILGRRVEAVAIPFGRYDRRVLRALRRAGYDRVYTSDGGPATEGDWLQARNSIHPHQDEKEIARILSGSEPPTATVLRAMKKAAKRWR